MQFGPFLCRTEREIFQIDDVASARALLNSLDESYRGRLHWQVVERRLDWVGHGREMIVHADEAFHNALRLEGWLAR